MKERLWSAGARSKSTWQFITHRRVKADAEAGLLQTAADRTGVRARQVNLGATVGGASTGLQAGAGQLAQILHAEHIVLQEKKGQEWWDMEVSFDLLAECVLGTDEQPIENAP